MKSTYSHIRIFRQDDFYTNFWDLYFPVFLRISLRICWLLIIMFKILSFKRFRLDIFFKLFFLFSSIRSLKGTNRWKTTLKIEKIIRTSDDTYCGSKSTRIWSIRLRKEKSLFTRKGWKYPVHGSVYGNYVADGVAETKRDIIGCGIVSEYRDEKVFIRSFPRFVSLYGNGYSIIWRGIKTRDINTRIQKRNVENIISTNGNRYCLFSNFSEVKSTLVTKIVT